MATNLDVELPDQGDNIIRTKDLEVNPNPAGFGHELFINLKKHGDAVAQIVAESGETDTFNALLYRCIRVALNLRERGIGPGDVVTPCTSNHLNTAVAMIAPLLVGAKIACLDHTGLFSDNKVLIDLVKPKLIFASEEAVENLEKILEQLNFDTEIVVFGQSQKHTPFDNLLRPFPKDEEDNFEPYHITDLFETAVIAFSSGSTGTPKGLCINHFTILCQLGKVKGNLITTTIVFSPLAWISGQFVTATNVIFGSPRLICQAFTPEKIWNYLVKYEVQMLTLPPQDAMVMLRYGNPDKIEVPNLRMFIIGGGKASVENMNAIRKIFLHPVLVFCPYGQSEIYGSCFDFDIAQFIKKPECVGKPSRGFWYKVVDPVTDKIYGPNKQGELLIKTKFCMNGYYNLDTSDRFDSDGFLRTGDVVYYDDDHCFYTVERLGEALKYRSQWIPPSLLESILYEHPAVRVACVIGIVLGDGDIATGVVVKQDGKEVTEEDLVKFVNDRVDNIKKLRGGILFVDESLIPYTASGKVRRFLVKKRVVEKYEEEIKNRISRYVFENV